jgi:hypothetical protein
MNTGFKMWHGRRKRISAEAMGPRFRGDDIGELIDQSDLPSQDEAHRAEVAQLVRVNEHAALFDAE